MLLNIKPTINYCIMIEDEKQALIIKCLGRTFASSGCCQIGAQCSDGFSPIAPRTAKIVNQIQNLEFLIFLAFLIIEMTC